MEIPHPQSVVCFFWNSPLKKEHEISGSSSDQKQIMWNFHGSWFLVLEFPSGATQFCGISKGEALFSPEFP